MDISTDAKLEELIQEYSKRGEAFGVDFRALVPWITSIDRATHLIHPYPAKLLVHIPHFFLSNNTLSKPGDVVLDSFCGSGTVLLESILSGRSAIGADTNPLAQLISRVKTTPLEPVGLAEALRTVVQEIRSSSLSVPRPDVVNLEYWFTPNVIQQMANILHCIHHVQSDAIREFFLVCLSAVVRRVSLADPRLSVPVRLRPDKYPEGHWFRTEASLYLERLKTIDVVEEFVRVSEANIRRITEVYNWSIKKGTASILATDATNLVLPGPSAKEYLPSGSIQLVITSPPYAGAQKYVRASSLNMGWLGLSASRELKRYEDLSIGREHFPRAAYRTAVSTGIVEADVVLDSVRQENPLRAHIAATYLVEMRSAFQELYRVLKPGGYLVLVAANNQVCNREFRTFEYLNRLLSDLGMENLLVVHDHIRSRSLMTKRHKTAGVITKEWVGVFRKRG